MVRLETYEESFYIKLRITFTFQYGQIRNATVPLLFANALVIYIPVWLDQKPKNHILILLNLCYLHSSMVRLETYNTYRNVLNMPIFTFQYGQIRNEICKKTTKKDLKIYIPVWLDQKRIYLLQESKKDLDLHSSMVRLETQRRRGRRNY